MGQGETWGPSCQLQGQGLGYDSGAEKVTSLGEAGRALGAEAGVMENEAGWVAGRAYPKTEARVPALGRPMGERVLAYAQRSWG